MKHIKKIFYMSCFILLFGNFNLIHCEWTIQPNPYTYDFQGVATINENTGWICGRHGIVLRTTNGGTNWINVGNKPPIDTNDIISIYALDENTAFVTTVIMSNLVTELYKTSDGGQSWQIVIKQPYGYIDHFAFKDSLNGFCLGDPVGGRWSLWATSNRGETWDSSGLYLPDGGGEVSFNRDLEIRGNDIWFGTNKNKIYHSSDFGQTWESRDVSCNIIVILTLWGNIGFAGEACTFKTTNGGNNWFHINLPLPEVWLFYVYSLNNKFWFTKEFRIYYSSDGGNNFILQFSLPNPDAIWQISLKENNNKITGWAISNDGKIIRYTEPIGIQPTSNEVPNEFVLLQNYPNPFNPATTIKYQVRTSSLIKLTVYDMLGREVSAIVNENQKPGTYSVSFDGSNLSSGVYYYRLTTDGEVVDTKKMMMIK